MAVSELEAVFAFLGEDRPVTVPIVPPEGSAARYLSWFAIRTARPDEPQTDVVRLGFQLHTRDVRDLHTICTRNSRVGVECGMCGYAITAVEPVDALLGLAAHHDEAHPRRVPRYLLRELVPDERRIERRYW